MTAPARIRRAVAAAASALIAATLLSAPAHADEYRTRTFTNAEGTTWTFRTYPDTGVTSVIRTGTAGWCSDAFLPDDRYSDGDLCGFPPGVGTTEVNP